MNPVSPYPVLPIILIALATMYGMGKLLHIRPATGRFASIDGLRGYMAFFVFFHHSCIWFFATHGYGWGHPPSWLYDQFGSTSVSVFFMITAFLFFNKLLQARGSNLNWLKLYIGRGLRILPLYFFVVVLLFLVVGLLTGFRLRTPAGDLLLGMLKWLAFIQTNINGVFPTSRIVAGVVWSLVFEWLFYCSLPFIGRFLKIRATALTLIPALAGLLFCILVIDEFYPMGGWRRAAPFLSGMIAAVLVRNNWVRKVAPGSVVSVCMVVAMALIVELYPSVYDPVPLLMMTFVFTAIAGGNNLFGILTHPLSRIFGQISYSIYLLHGMVLFITFTWILGPDLPGRFSPLEHWGVIALCGAGVVVVSSLTYRFIERPALDAAPRTTERIRKIFGRKRAILQ
jgi:peptidoglycan/LPS O-acetylase OafA/YrhL